MRHILPFFGVGLVFLGLSVGAVRSAAQQEKAVFAGGCFWCMTPPFEKLPGVKEVLAGYTDGDLRTEPGVVLAGGKHPLHTPEVKENGSRPRLRSAPTYKDYADRGFVEAVQVTYDPSVVTYPQLLDVFWRQINPTDPNGQFVDRGPQYRAAVFYLNDEQKRLAEKSKRDLDKSGLYDKPILTEIKKASAFWPAEEYHQDYYRKNPVQYEIYHAGSGREQYLQRIWKNAAVPTTASGVGNTFQKPSKEALKKKLTPLQYEVTQEKDTEPPFHNAYWDNHREGIYVDVVSGEPLFSSKDKFDSGTGWPCFMKPIEEGTLVEKPDHSLLLERTEVRSRTADSHLGHVFDDGPGPTHLRFCINSAALRFVPKEDLEKEGYGRYLKLFGKQ